VTSAMSDADSFLTIDRPGRAEIKIKGSKFIGRAVPCADEGEARAVLDDIRKKDYDASHHCYAYHIGTGSRSVFHYSDAGEPSGTAGRPIFDHITGQNLTDLIIVVTRYFGGTKLGTGGLTRAYSQAAEASLAATRTVERFLTCKVAMTIPFSDYNNVERLLRENDCTIVKNDFSDLVRLTAAVRQSRVADIKGRLIELTSARISFDETA